MTVANEDFRRVCVVGLGYIGLPTAAVIADRGTPVLGVDVKRRVVDTVNAGEIHIVEPDLHQVVERVVAAGRLVASTTPEPADAFVIAVPTPTDADHRPDVRYIRSAAESIAPVLAAGNLVVLESTSPVGTTEMLVETLAAARPDLSFPTDGGGFADVSVAYCPERVLPGRVLTELVRNDRIIGGITPRCAERAAELYRLFVEGECVETSARTAEMSKLAENACRDVNIAYANELSMVCDTLGIDVWELIEVANRHPRVNILQPGCGVGGHCIAVDPWFIVHSDPQNANLIRTARRVNDRKPHYVLEQVRSACRGLERPKVACLGLAFKPDIDDLRESPAVQIVRDLADAGDATVLAVEPHIDELPAALADAGVVLVDFTDALAVADVVVLLVDHTAFTTVDADLLVGKPVIDTRGQWRHLPQTPARQRVTVQR